MIEGLEMIKAMTLENVESSLSIDSVSATFQSWTSEIHEVHLHRREKLLWKQEQKNYSVESAGCIASL